MKTTLYRVFTGLFFILAVASPIVALTSPQTVSAAEECEQRILGIPPWYRGLTTDKDHDCALVSPDTMGGLGNYIWRIALNVIEMALVAATYVTVFYILYGGFLFITGGAIPAQIEKGRKTVLYAVIGLVICIGAIAAVNLIYKVLG